jgi:sugar O-acyltransferase (sialic acid O-acetyltransferase NeuD family)
MKRYIYGAGGHGKVVLDAMQLARLRCDGFIDDNDEGATWMGLTVQAFSDLSFNDEISLHLAIGNGKLRESIVNKLGIASFFSVFHPDASIAQTGLIGLGTLIAAQAVVAPSTQIGHHCIINHSSVVDHDCIVGDFSHIAPQSSLGGTSKIGKGVLVGAGAVIFPGIAVGDFAVVGAGAIVTKNVPAGAVVIGNPAKKVN